MQLNNVQIVMSSAALLLGFFLVRWLVSRNRSAKPAVKRTPVISAPAPVKIKVTADEEEDKTHTPVQRKVVESSDPNLLSPESSGDGLKPRRLSMKGSPDVQINHLSRLKNLSKSRLKTDIGVPKVALTAEELEGIETIKEWLIRDEIERCKIPGHHAADDSFIGRFVRGKKLDLDKAYEQLKSCLAWRKENRIDTILDWFRVEYPKAAEGMDNYYPWQNHGVDHNGVTVVWDRLPSMDFKTLMNAFTKDELIYWHIEHMERNAQSMYEKGQYGGVFVEDFSGLSMGHWYKPAVEFLKVMMHVDQQNYPEFSNGIYYINSPRVLSVLWPLLKPFMDPLTVQKVFISSEGGADIFPKFLPLTSAPKEYGGTCEICKGEKCLDYSLGGPFLSTKEKRITTVTIGARAYHDVVLEVAETEAPVLMTWWFSCNPSTDDIEMKVFKEGDEGNVIHDGAKLGVGEGTCELSDPGRYVVRYNNDYSYWSSKQVGFHHKMVPMSNQSKNEN